MATLDPKHTTSSTKPIRYSINLNVVLSGSKKMSDDELDHAVADQPHSVHVTILDPATGKVLIDDIVVMNRFSTGSVGYGLQRSNAWFLENE